MIEIERKFLIRGHFKDCAVKSKRIKQGYLSSVPERIVRVRIVDNDAFLTIKGISNKNGTERFEWERNIPVVEAESLLRLCETGLIEKIRYYVPAGKHVFEVDEFYGDNKGLKIAEIELQSENEEFEKPSWLGREVTGDIKYYNSALTKNPYKNWNK